MIPPESKAKLEEMAKKAHDMIGDQLALKWEYVAAWQEGATAAWKMATELAVKAERDRILLESRHKLSHWAHQALIPIILDLPKDEAEK